jgi:hypothetical protein
VFLHSSSGDGDFVYMDVGGAFGEATWIGYQSGNWQFQDKTSIFTYTYSQALTSGAWTHLALTYDGTNCRSYINGSLVNTGAVNLSTRLNSNGGDIGSSGDATYQGMMVFTSALSAAQIQAAMKLAPPISSYAWYKFDQASPTTDSSGNSHTLSGAGSSNGAQLLIAGDTVGIATTTAASGTLSIGGGAVALSSTAFATVTALSGTLRADAPLASSGGGVATVTAASGTLRADAPLVSTAFNTVTAMSGALEVTKQLVSTALDTVTAMSGTLSIGGSGAVPLVSTAFSTVTAMSGTLSTAAPLISIGGGNATVTGMFGTLSGGVAPPSSPYSGDGTARRFAQHGRRRAR